MMRIESTFPPEIIGSQADVKVSIYMETSQTAPDNKSNRLQFKNLMNEALSEIHDKKLKATIGTRLNELHDNESFWIHVKQGLALLMDEQEMVIYLLGRKFSNVASVGKYFNLNPLLRHFQSDDVYYILGLSKDTFSVYQGNRYQIEEVQFPDDIEMSMADVLGTQTEGRTLNVGSYGGVGTGSYHGHNARSEEEKVDLQRYYLYIDRFISEHLEKGQDNPIILLGLDQHIGEFRKITKNPHILKDSVFISLESIKNKEKDLHAEVWPVIERQLLKETADLMDSFEKRYELEEGSSDLAEIYRALLEGRVGTLVLEDLKLYPNKDLFLEDFSEDVDVLSVLLDLAFRTKCEIIILPKEKMPSDTGAFALYRY